MNGWLREIGAWASGVFAGGVAWLHDINWLVVIAVSAPLAATVDRLHATWSRHRRNREITGD